MKRILVIGLSIISIARIESFIFEIHSIRKKDSQHDGPEWVIGLGDLHDKRHPSNQSHKQAIMRFLFSLPKGQVKILTEDLSSPGSFGRKECGNFYVNSRGGVLGGFTQDCAHHGFDTENHEFRYCRVSSLGPVINNLQTDVARLGSPAVIKLAALHDEIQREIEQIRHFDDGPVLKKAYDHNIAYTKKMLAKLRITPNDQTSVADYIKKHIPNDKLIDCIKALLTFDSELLDCKLVHAIKQEKHKKYVIIIAGGAHVKRVCDLLLKDGYEKHISYDAQDEHVTDKNRCIGRSLVDGAYCIMPKAVDLSCLPACCKR